MLGVPQFGFQPPNNQKMTSRALMIQGTGSDVGKSVIVAGLCRVIRRKGRTVAPFKPQNMSNNAAACACGGEIGRAQALQARAAGIDPEVDLNPVLLKPQSDCTSQVVVHGKVVANLDARNFLKDRFWMMEPVLHSFRKLSDSYEYVLVEGAGSAAETNLRKRDIANMGFARAANVPVALLADIDRGGVIASVVGTKTVLDCDDAAMIRSFIVNKFRGDTSLFAGGVQDIERHTGWPCRGVIPWSKSARRLPQEDSVIHDSLVPEHAEKMNSKVKIAVPMLSRIANSDDFDPLRSEPNVEFQFIRPGSPIPRDADVIIVPGTKSTLSDLRFLREQGWDHDIIAHARSGARVLGLCGGYQLLGRKIRDLNGIEGRPGSADGLGLLDVETDMNDDKTVRPLNGVCVTTGSIVNGYEIHIGETRGPDTVRRMIRSEHGEDGAASSDGNISGCYVHGLFSSDQFRSRWLNGVRENTSSRLCYEASVEDSLEQLADELEAALNIDALLEDACPPRF